MPRPYERRLRGSYPYYKLAMWCPHAVCWVDLRTAYSAERDAVAAANRFGFGRYRVSEVDEHGRLDRSPFEIVS